MRKWLKGMWRDYVIRMIAVLVTLPLAITYAILKVKYHSDHFVLYFAPSIAIMLIVIFVLDRRWPKP